MASRSRTVWKVKRGIYAVEEFGEVTVSNADTFTLGNHFATANPYYVTVRKHLDGTEMSVTYAAGTNVVTVTGAGTNVPCVYMATGRKA